ncbi:MAG: hypothetical protein IKJ99_02915 [Oscillospiraceae bacterium]|nr:hypothetical protein [Oscillospiraceae bacterium]
MKIEKNGDLIERDWLLQELEHDLSCFQTGVKNPETLYVHLGDVVRMVLEAPKVPALRVPCREGDQVWVIRNYQGVKHPQQGTVSELTITKDLRLMITVKHIARGEWGKEVFATYEEARRASLEGRK